MNPRVFRGKSDALRVAIIGAGLMGYWHGRAAHRLGADIIAIADPDTRRAQALARRLRVAAVAADLSEVIRARRVDAVHICSPPSTHRALAGRALEAGIHAIVEKPLTNTADETRALVELACRRGAVLCPVHQIAFQDCLRNAAQSLNRLGEPCVIDIRICSAGGTGRTEREVDEIVADILPHPLSLLRKQWPRAVWNPQDWSVCHRHAGELSVSGMFAGAHLSMLISMEARPPRFEMTVCGPRGTLQFDLFHGFAVHHDGGATRLRKAARPCATALKLFGAASANLAGRGLRGEVAYPGLRSLVRGFYASARGEAPAPIPAEDMIAVAAARDVILLDANRTRQAVDRRKFAITGTSGGQPHIGAG
ncbi:MAG TPA: Gfo/Idh/MocA family oxidoreductase [Stellaceae bacterium]|nr:Gfo/Idh/MocA family oxidoreductase [Stellaceae bacterium]